MLTNAAVKAAGARSRAYKIFDGHGLHLLVTPAGGKSWRLKYRHGGREKLLTFGLWPAVSLADARARCDVARAAIAAGADPSRPATSIDTFEQLARAWHDQRRSRWTDVHARDVLASLELHAFPAIGAKRPEDIDVEDVLELLQRLEADGSIETARRLRQRISAAFKFAIVRKFATHDPAAALAAELADAPVVKHHPAITHIDQARALYAAIGADSVAAIAHQLLALTTVRLGALRGARWDEIEDLDGDTPTWRIPAARMKLRRAKKLDSTRDHLVPLAPAAVELLTKMRQDAPKCTTLVFPGRRENLPIGEGAIGALIRETRFAGEHVPHGWRSSFSTIMNERRPADRAAIDLVLAHTPKDKVEAAYNRAEQLQRRRAILEDWAQLLTSH